MAITVKHSKVSTIPDDADTDLIRPSDWNADHALTGVIDVANGGTGQSTATAGFNALAPSQTANSGKYLTTNGTNTSWATVAGGGVTSITAGSGLSGGTITTSGTIALDINSLASTTVVADDLVPVYDVSASANADCLASDIAGLGVGSIGYKNNFYYFPYLMSSIGSTTTAVANRLYYLPFFVRKKTTFTRIGIQVVVLGGTSARLGIYNAANGIPTSLLLDCGTISTASSGEKEATISQSLNTGFYFLAFVADGTPVIQITTNNAQASSYAVGQFVRDNIAYGYFSSNGSITLPSTATSLQDASTTPAVSLRIV
jgi:hypothetical protein